MGIRRATEKIPAVRWLLALALLVVILVLLSHLSPDLVYGRFVRPYLWEPIVRDEGYNPVNTAALFVVLGLLAAWIYELLRRFGIRIDFPLVLAGLLLQPAGAIIRVLEDADYFAPFEEDIRRARPDLPATATCVPEVGGGFLHECLSGIMVTPPIYVWLTLLVGAFGRTAHWAQRVDRQQGTRAALRFYLLSVLSLLLLGLAWTASRPTYVRGPPPIGWLLLAAIVPAAVVSLVTIRHTRRFDWRLGLFGYVLFVFLYASYPVTLWTLGGTTTWHPTTGLRPWLAPAALFAVLAFVVFVRWQAARLSARGGSKGRPTPRPWMRLGYLVVLDGFALFFVAAGLVALAGEWTGISRRDAWGWLMSGLLVPAAGAWLLRPSGAGRARPGVAVMMAPFNLLMLAGQYADGLLTSLGLDLFGASEKHVLPRTLIAGVRAAGLGGPASSYATLLVLVPWKLILALALVWGFDVRYKDALEGRPNVAPLVKGIVLIVGLSPACRDLLRLTMGV